MLENVVILTLACGKMYKKFVQFVLDLRKF